jgi:hypothetical protein
MDQNEEIFVRFMNEPLFQRQVTEWLAAEAYKRFRRGSAVPGIPYADVAPTADDSKSPGGYAFEDPL